MLSRRLAWSVALIATFTMTVSYVDRMTLAALAPTVTKQLGISDTAYGWLTSAFSIAYLVSTPVAGWWIDRVGARRGLVWSVLGWTTIAAMHAFVPTFGVLFALRIALGMAEGPSFPGAAQTLQRVLPAEDRARGFGVLFSGSSIGSMITPLLASALFVLGGWRFAFAAAAIAGLVWLPLWLGVTSLPAVRAKLDAPAAVTAQPRATVGQLLVHPLTLRALVAILAAAPVTGFVLAWGAKYLTKTFDVAQADIGQYLWLPPLLFDAGTIGFGDLASRTRRRADAPPRLLFAVAIPLATCIALVPFATTPWTSIAFMGLALIGAGGIYTLTTADFLSRVPAGSVSLAGGTIACAQSLILIIANPLIGWSIDVHHDYDLVSWSLGAWVLPGTIAWLAWRPRAFA